MEIINKKISKARKTALVPKIIKIGNALNKPIIETNLIFFEIDKPIKKKGKHKKSIEDTKFLFAKKLVISPALRNNFSPLISFIIKS